MRAGVVLQGEMLMDGERRGSLIADVGENCKREINLQYCCCAALARSLQTQTPRNIYHTSTIPLTLSLEREGKLQAINISIGVHHTQLRGFFKLRYSDEGNTEAGNEQQWKTTVKNEIKQNVSHSP